MNQQWSVIIPLILGSITILQGALNARITQNIGVNYATLLTNAGTFLICLILYFLAKHSNTFVPEYFEIKTPFTSYKWWYVIPPIMGFLIVVGLSFSMEKIGAVKVTVLLIVAQMLTSIAWDYFVYNLNLSAMKIIGLFFAALSVFFITIAK